MSAAEESPILIPSEDEEEDGDEVQYIKEEKAPPITIDETEEQDDVIFVSTCPAPPPPLTTSWDDALAMDLDSFTIPSPSSSPTPTTTCSADMPALSGGSSLSGPFCPMSALLDSSTPPSLPISTNPVAPVSADLSQAKLSVPVLGSDLSLGAGSDLSMTDSSTNLTALSGTGLSLASVTSDLASLSDSGNLTLPSVSGSLSGLPGACQSSGGLGESKTVLTSEASQTVFSFHPTSSPLDLSQRDKACQLLTVRKKKVRHSPFSSPLGDLDSSSSEESSSDDSDHADNNSDPRNSDLANSDDPDNSDEAEKSDDPDNSDDEGNSVVMSEEEEDPGKVCLPVVSGGTKVKSGVVANISPPTPLTSPPSSPSLSGWLDLALKNNVPPPSSASAPSASSQTGVSGTAKVTQPFSGPPVIDKCRDSQALGAPSTSSPPSNPTSFSSQVMGHAQPPVSTSATSSSSLLVTHATTSLGSSPVPPTLPGAPPSQGVFLPVSPVQPVSAQVSVNPSVTVSQQASVSHSTSISNSSSSTSLKPVPICAAAVVGATGARQQTGAADHPLQSTSTSGGGGSQGQSLGRQNSMDFLDKLFDDCSSIISMMSSTSSSSTPSTSTASMPVSHGAPSSMADTKVLGSGSMVTDRLAGGAGMPGGSSSSSGEKGTKRPSTTSLSCLDTASLPPRKRVLKHSTSFTLPPSQAPSLYFSRLSPLLPTTPTSSHAPSTYSSPVGCLLTNAKDRDLTASTSSLLSRWTTWRDDDLAGSSKAGPAATEKVSGASSGMEMACNWCGKKEGERIGEQPCRLSQCIARHMACGDCLLVQARRVLSGKQKESLKCIEVGCGSFYPMNELKKSLPAIIVEILQERLDQDFVDFIDSISNKTAEDDAEAKKTPSKHGKACCRKKAPQTKFSRIHCVTDSSSSDADDEDEEEEEEEKSKSGKEAGSYVDWMKGGEQTLDGATSSKRKGSSSDDSPSHSDFPEHWTNLDNSKNLVEVVAVPLEPNSEEYINVAVRFHEHMLFPAADITRIVRIQNPYLWKSYSLKKEQMIQENGGRVVSEHQLFHGTKVSTIDAICRRGFDWRFCGKHGTAFGQGCYFAGDSLYSNAYTDRGSAPSSGSVILKSILQLPPSSSDPSTTVFPPDPSLSTSIHTPQASQPSSRLRVPQTGGGGGLSGVGSGGAPMTGKAGLAMKKLLPLLKGKMGDKNAIIAHLLKAKTDKHRAALAGGYSSPRPGSSGGRSASGGLMYGPGSSGSPSGPPPASNLMFGAGRASGPVTHPPPNGPPPPSTAQHPRSVPCRQQQGPVCSSQSAGPPHRQPVYAHQRYTLISGHPRSHSSAPSAAPSFPPGQGLPPSQPSLHPTSVAPLNQPPPAGFRALGKAAYPAQPAKKYGSRPAFGGVGKVSALMAPSSSSQSSPGQGNGGVMVPVGGYPNNLSVASTAVTLSGAPSLALLTANTSLQANSYLLVAPLPPNPAPLPPLAPLPQHTHTLLSQPTPLPAPKAGSWSSSSSGSQALDLRKAGSCPRYMFLAKVLSGIFTGGQSDYRRPPPLDPNDPLGRCYDSCVDNIHTPRIWVIFDSTQAYPEYAIEYQVNGDMYR